jgi:nitroimidazol reductase NimA-like FMN-containing flavoprotein (pyridoxamine 5'-phosphate oxidase superfamily)
LPERGVYDRTAIDAILDEGLVCHVGFSSDGQTYVIPCVYARIGATGSTCTAHRRVGCCARWRLAPPHA